MFRLTQTPRIRAMDYIHCPAETLLRKESSQTDFLGIRAAIFQTIDGKSHLLVVQRAGSDSKPHLWELPGGGVDDGGECLKDALYREIKEETGLTASWITQEVGQGQRYEKRLADGRLARTLCVTFIVEAEEIEFLERGGGEGSRHGATEGNGGTTRTFPNSASPSIKEALQQIPVSLDPKEHQRYLWLSKEELLASSEAEDKSGRALEFTSDDTYRTMLQACDLHQEVLRERASMS